MKLADEGMLESRRDELIALAIEIHKEIKKGSARHILNILEEVCKKFRRQTAAEISQLIASIDYPNPNQKFLYDNIAYQALILLIRTWPKKDYHCHVSPSLSVDWVIKQVRANWSTYAKEFDRRFRDSGWMRANKGTVTLEAMKAFCSKGSAEEKKGRVERAYRRYANPTDAFDLPMCYSQGKAEDILEIFIDGVKCAVWNYFDDGVRCIQIRFNPCKSFHGVQIPIEDTLCKMHELLEHEERAANKLYGGQHRVQFMLCFNQSRYTESQKIFTEEVRRVLESYEVYVERICGIDFSGPEMPETARGGWKDLREIAIAKEIRFVTHVGDRWNLTEVFNEDVFAHLDYTEAAMQLDGMECVGHGNVLNPWGIWMRRDLDCAERYFDDKRSDHRKRVDSILETMAREEITIECLPKVEFGFIDVMKRHPFYYWLSKGVPLDIGIDGTCYIPASFSEWIAWLVLGSPREATRELAVLTVSEIRKIVMWDHRMWSPSPIAFG